MKSIFISSTFKDMQSERDYIHEQIVPKLRTLVNDYGDDIRELDLRWGVNTLGLSEEESGELVLKVCIDAIDRCCPFFIVLLGERYGWIPEEKIVNQLNDQRIQEHYDSGISVTNLEINYGAFSNENYLERCIFCFRDASVLDQIGADYIKNYESESIVHKEQLQKLKNRIRNNKDSHIIEYTATWNQNKECIDGLQDFGSKLLSVLKTMLKEDYKNYEIPSGIEKIGMDIEITKQNHLKTYVPRAYQEYDVLKDLLIIYKKRYMDVPFPNRNRDLECLEERTVLLTQIEKTPSSILNRKNVLGSVLEEQWNENKIKYPFWLYGTSGSGKTAMMSYLENEMKSHGIHTILFFGGNSGCQDKDTLKRWIVFRLEEILRRNHSEAQEDVNGRLRELNGDLENKKLGVVCFIDSLDQLLETYDDLQMDIVALCPYMTFVFTSTEDLTEKMEEVLPLQKDVYKDARKYQLDCMEKSTQKKFITLKAKERGKSIDEDTVIEILSKEGSDSPLYLSMILQRLFMMNQLDFNRAEKMALGMEGLHLFMSQLINQLPENTENMTQILLEETSRRMQLKQSSIIWEILASIKFGLKEIELENILRHMSVDFYPLQFQQIVSYLYDMFEQDIRGCWRFKHKSYRDAVLNQTSEQTMNRIKEAGIAYSFEDIEYMEREGIYQIFSTKHVTGAKAMGYIKLFHTKKPIEEYLEKLCVDETYLNYFKDMAWKHPEYAEDILSVWTKKQVSSISQDLANSIHDMIIKLISLETVSVETKVSGYYFLVDYAHEYEASVLNIKEYGKLALKWIDKLEDAVKRIEEQDELYLLLVWNLGNYKEGFEEAMTYISVVEKKYQNYIEGRINPVYEDRIYNYLWMQIYKIRILSRWQDKKSLDDLKRIFSNKNLWFVFSTNMAMMALKSCSMSEYVRQNSIGKDKDYHEAYNVGKLAIQEHKKVLELEDSQKNLENLILAYECYNRAVKKEYKYEAMVEEISYAERLYYTYHSDYCKERYAKTCYKFSEYLRYYQDFLRENGKSFSDEVGWANGRRIEYRNTGYLVFKELYEKKYRNLDVLFFLSYYIKEGREMLKETHMYLREQDLWCFNNIIHYLKDLSSDFLKINEKKKYEYLYEAHRVFIETPYKQQTYKKNEEHCREAIRCLEKLIELDTDNDYKDELNKLKKLYVQITFEQKEKNFGEKIIQSADKYMEEKNYEAAFEKYCSCIFKITDELQRDYHDFPVEDIKIQLIYALYKADCVSLCAKLDDDKRGIRFELAYIRTSDIWNRKEAKVYADKILKFIMDAGIECVYENHEELYMLKAIIESMVRRGSDLMTQMEELFVNKCFASFDYFSILEKNNLNKQGDYTFENLSHVGFDKNNFTMGAFSRYDFILMLYAEKTMKMCLMEDNIWYRRYSLLKACYEEQIEDVEIILHCLKFEQRDNYFGNKKDDLAEIIAYIYMEDKRRNYEQAKKIYKQIIKLMDNELNIYTFYTEIYKKANYFFYDVSCLYVQFIFYKLSFKYVENPISVLFYFIAFYCHKVFSYTINFEDFNCIKYMSKIEQDYNRFICECSLSLIGDSFEKSDLLNDMNCNLGFYDIEDVINNIYNFSYGTKKWIEEDRFHVCLFLYQIVYVNDKDKTKEYKYFKYLYDFLMREENMWDIYSDREWEFIHSIEELDKSRFSDFNYQYKKMKFENKSADKDVSEKLINQNINDTFWKIVNEHGYSKTHDRQELYKYFIEDVELFKDIYVYHEGIYLNFRGRNSMEDFVDLIYKNESLFEKKHSLWEEQNYEIEVQYMKFLRDNDFLFVITDSLWKYMTEDLVKRPPLPIYIRVAECRKNQLEEFSTVCDSYLNKHPIDMVHILWDEMFWRELKKYESDYECKRKNYEEHKTKESWEGYVKCSEDIGSTYKKYGLMEKILEKYEECLDLARKRAEDEGTIESYWDYMLRCEKMRCFYEYDGENKEKALEKKEESLEIRRKICEIDGTVGNQKEYIKECKWLAKAYEENNQIEKALEIYENYLALIYEKNRVLDTVESQYDYIRKCNEVGDIYTIYKKWEKALEKYEEGLKCNSKMGEKTSEARELYIAGLSRLGSVYKEMGRFEESLKKYEESIELFRKLYDEGYVSGDNLIRYDSMVGLYEKQGEVYEALGKLDEASRIYDIGLKLLQKVFEGPLDDWFAGIIYDRVCAISEKQGRIYELYGNVNNALEEYEISLEFSRKYYKRWEDSESKWRDEGQKRYGIYCKKVGDFYERQEEYEKAIEKYEEAMVLMKNLYDRRKTSQSLKDYTGICDILYNLYHTLGMSIEVAAIKKIRDNI